MPHHFKIIQRQIFGAKLDQKMIRTSDQRGANCFWIADNLARMDFGGGGARERLALLQRGWRAM
jgi:hypothetical protein